MKKSLKKAMKYLLFILFFLFQMPVSAQNSPQKFVDSLVADIEKKYPENRTLKDYKDFEEFFNYLDKVLMNIVLYQSLPNQTLLRQHFQENDFWLAFLYFYEGVKNIDNKKEKESQEAMEKAIFHFKKVVPSDKKYMVINKLIKHLFFKKTEDEMLAFLDYFEKEKGECKYKK